LKISTVFAKRSHVSLNAQLVPMVRRELATALMRNLSDRDRMIGMQVVPQARDLD